MGAHQGSGQEGGQQHPPLGWQGIHPSSIGGGEGVGGVQGQEGGEEGRKLHGVAVQGHDDALQHADSGLVGCGDALRVFAACSSQQNQSPGGLVRWGGGGEPVTGLPYPDQLLKCARTTFIKQCMLRER